MTDEPVLKEFSLRLQALVRSPEAKPEDKDLGVAIYAIFDMKGKGMAEDMLEYGHAVSVSRAKLEELFRTGECLVCRMDLSKPRRSLGETENIPIEEIHREETMRTITDHIVEGDLPQNQLKIVVLDEPGAGGANHRYKIGEMHLEDNPSFSETDYDMDFDESLILFQNGPIKESGVNGITNEVLLAIVIDRLRSFQAGPFPSELNGIALENCQQALAALQERTRERIARGVEGETKA